MDWHVPALRRDSARGAARAAPVLGLSATLQQIRDSVKLPAVGASVELGVAGGAEPSGEGVV